MAFKCMMVLAPEYFGKKFISRGNISGRATRSSQQLNIPLFLKVKQGSDPFLIELLIYEIIYPGAGGKLLPIHSLKYNRNDVLTTCKAISLEIVSGLLHCARAYSTVLSTSL